MSECLEKVEKEFKHSNVVDILAAGPNILFVHRESYPITRRMPRGESWGMLEEINLAYALFASTIAYNLSDPITIPTEWAWFPMEEDAGEKEDG